VTYHISFVRIRTQCHGGNSCVTRRVSWV